MHKFQLNNQTWRHHNFIHGLRGFHGSRRQAVKRRITVIDRRVLLDGPSP